MWKGRLPRFISAEPIRCHQSRSTSRKTTATLFPDMRVGKAMVGLLETNGYSAMVWRGTAS
jgi:hypothetical protein